jgi:hypothetical protein
MFRKISQGGNGMKDSKDVETFLTEIEKELPPIVFRNWKRWRDVLPMSPRTLANQDSLGTGPKERVYMGRAVGYPRASFMQYLRDITRVDQ